LFPGGTAIKDDVIQMALRQRRGGPQPGRSHWTTSETRRDCIKSTQRLRSASSAIRYHQATRSVPYLCNRNYQEILILLSGFTCENIKHLSMDQAAARAFYSTNDTACLY